MRDLPSPWPAFPPCASRPGDPAHVAHRCMGRFGAIHHLAHPQARPLPTSSSSPRSRPATAKTPPQKHRRVQHTSRAARVAHTARIKRAFVASTELRPMAQQLATLRTPEAYAGVAAYARSHTGDAAAAAYLALGHAYLLGQALCRGGNGARRGQARRRRAGRLRRFS